jgi:RNA polymerase sigma-70 factor (ECF subfamily)
MDAGYVDAIDENALCHAETSEGVGKTDEDPVSLLVKEMPRLRRYAQYLTRNPAEADDLAQESLATALAKIDLWNHGTNMRAWLFTIQRNLFITAIRRATRAPFIDDPNVIEETAGTPSGQEQNLYLGEVEEVISKLRGDHKEVISLVVFGELSYEQAAAMIAVPVGTIRSRLSRARQALKYNGCQYQPCQDLR